MRVFHVQFSAVRFIPAELHLFSTFVTEIIMLDGLTIVYRSSVDVFFYVIGSQQENELILVATLNAIFDAISLLTKKSVEKRTLLSNLDAVYLGKESRVCD